MSPRTCFLLSAPSLAVVLLASSCTSETDPGELRDLLVEDGLVEAHIEVSGPDAEGILWATYDMREDCELQLRWDGEGEVLVLGSHTEGYFQEAPEGTTLESFDPAALTQTCDGKF